LLLLPNLSLLCRCCCCCCPAGNPDALWLLGGLLPVQPARVAKTLQAHREAAHRQVSEEAVESCYTLHVLRITL
jgi:hypothetical protein